MEKEIRKLFGELVKRWKHTSKESEEKLEEAKKQKSLLDDEVTKLRE